MAVREFDGVDDDIQMAIGGLSGMTYGTVAILLKRTATGSYQSGFITPHTSGGTPQWTVGFASSDTVYFWSGTAQSDGPILTNTTQWHLIVWRKGTGTAAPRISILNLSTGTWSHSAGTSIADGTSGGAGGTLRFSYGGGEFLDARVAARAAWSNSLPWSADTTGDAAIEAAGLEDSYQNWLDNSPTAAWKFDQASTGTAVVDDSTTGTADQSAITGTAVVTTDDPPGFSFGNTAVGKDLGLQWHTRAAVGDPLELRWNVEFIEPTFVADRASLAPVISSEASTLVDMASAGSITTGPDRYLIAHVSANNSGASGAACGLTVSDARNGTWTVHGPGLQDPGAADAGVACYVAMVKVTNAYTDGDDVTFAWSPNCTGKTIVIEEWRGIHSTNPVAVVATTAAGASGTPSISRTPTAAGQLFYGALAIEGLLADTYTQDADTTDGTWLTRTSQGGTGTAASTVTTRAATKLVTGTSAQTWNPTITSRDWAAVALVLAPYVATTAVGKDLGLQWDTRSAVGDTVQAIWDTRAALGDPLGLVWNTRQTIGDPLDVQWAVRTVAGDSAELVWNTRAAIGDALQLVWNVEDGLSAVGKDLGLIWDTRALAADDLQALWNTRAAIGDPLELQWATRAAVGDPLGLVWDIRGSVGDPVELQWAVRTAVGDPLELQWAVRAAIGDPLALLWNVEGALAAVGKNLGLAWDIRAPIGDTLQAVWHVRAAVADALALQWDVRQLLADELTAQWGVRILVGDEAALQWAVRAVLGDPLELRWNVEAHIGRALELQWNVESLVPPAEIPDVLTLRSVRRPLTLKAVRKPRTLEAYDDA